LYILQQEAHSRITRFILICNYVTRIIEPLASRCAKFRFMALPPATMKERVTAIAEAEGRKNNVIMEENQIDAVLAVSGGDMRRAVTSLQSVQALLAGQEGDNSKNNIIDEAVINELAGLPPDHVIDTLYQSLLSNRFNTMQSAVQNVIADGYSVQTLLQKLLDKFIVTDDLDELGRAKLAIRIAEAEDRMNDGADEYLQLMTVCGLALKCLYTASKKMKQ
jgi:replication factor C subunit 2/4